MSKTLATNIERHNDFLRRLVDGAAAVMVPLDWKKLNWDATVDSVQPFYDQLNANRALDAPRCAPELDLSAATWGGLVVHWACWAILDRGETNVELPPILTSREPSPAEAASHWSVDLMMAGWPQVASRCRSSSADDPLLNTIRELAFRWPLSAIGMGLSPEAARKQILQTEAWKTICSQSCLNQIARDRSEMSSELFFVEPS